MCVSTEVKDFLLKIGTKEKPVNPWKFLVGMFLFGILFIAILVVWGFMIVKGTNKAWLDFIFAFGLVCPIITIEIFYIWGLIRYSISGNK